MYARTSKPNADFTATVTATPLVTFGYVLVTLGYAFGYGHNMQIVSISGILLTS